MSQQIQHYQTSFVVKGGKLTGEYKLYQAQYLVGEWIKDIEKRRYLKRRRDKQSSFLIKGDFTHRAYYSSRYSWCKTNYCVTDGSKAWVVEYTHRDSDFWNVFWVSEIGLQSFEADGSLVVNVKITYKVSTEVELSGRPYRPGIAIPNVVLGLIETFDDCQFFSGGRDVSAEIKSTVWIKDASLANEISKYISSPDRKLAVVLLGGESPNVKKEADFLRKNLFGKALVYIVSFNLDVRKAFGRFRMNFDECYFLPTFRVLDKDVEYNLHYNVANEKIANEHHDVILRAWLGAHPIYEKGAVSSLADIQTLIRKQQLIKFEEKLKGRVSAEEYAKIQSELREVSGLFELSVQEVAELKSKNEDLEFQNMQWEDNTKTLIDLHKSELLGQSEKYKGMLRKRGESRALPRELPLSIDALKIWAQSFDNLIVVDKAWEGMRRRTQEDMVRTAWDMLWCLNYPVFRFYDGGIGGVPGDYIAAETGYEFSSNESETTKSRKEWVAQRTATVDGRPIECFKHLKNGVGASTAMRAYFEYDPELAWIVVAHIGEHLTTKATSRT